MEACASGCRKHSIASPESDRCASSRRAAYRGLKSIFRKITGRRAPTCCRPYPAATRLASSAASCVNPDTRPRNRQRELSMYERFYNLRERPFSLSPDPDYLFLSRVHTEALSYLRYGIEGHAGFVVITGEIGSGKTTLLQAAMRSLDSRISLARIVNTILDARELIEAIMLDFGLDPRPDQSKPHLLQDLAKFLVDQRTAGRLPLLIIDEAQNLCPAALEEVRMLSNLETEKSKLIQIILVGQPNLYDALLRPQLEQL